MARVTLVWSDVYLYTISNVNVHTPVSAGVYRLSYRSDDKRPVFYVGQAETLDKRLRDHLSEVEPNVCIKRNLQDHTCYFRFAELVQPAERDCAERALYENYKPECNLAAPPGEPCEINFS
jgi:excinuclease UvrABC nuclease subunit